MSITSEYADFVLSLKGVDAVPCDVLEICSNQALATIGSCFEGSHMPGIKALKESVGVFGQGGQSTAFGTNISLPAPSAALYNSAAAQVLDYDDWVLICHVGACVVPTAFAAGEYYDSSGEDVLKAITIGNEIAARTSRSMVRGAYIGNSMPNHQVDTPLVAGFLAGSNKTALIRALSHSCFMAMLSCTSGWTSDSKIFINGLPAMWGIASIEFANAGLVGTTDIVEHPGGYLATVSEKIETEELLKDLGTEWNTRTLNIKRFPSCAYNLSPIECGLALHQKIKGDTKSIKKIKIKGPGVMIYVGARYRAFDPSIFEKIRVGELSHMGLCFDPGYSTAAALVDGEMRYRQFLDNRIQDPEIRRLYESMEFEADEGMQKAYYSDYQYGATVEITLNDGRVLTETRSQLLGARDRPFNWDEKFLEGVEGILSPIQANEALDALKNLKTVDKIREVGALLRPV